MGTNRGQIRPSDPADSAAFEDAITERRWRDAFALLPDGMYEPKDAKFRFLLQFGEELSDQEYWQFVWDAYKRAFQGLDRLSNEELRTIFRGRAGAEQMMGMSDRELLDWLPDTLTIYRGYHQSQRQRRFSWTPSESAAAWFALLFHQSAGGDPMIVEGHAKKEDVIACFAHEAEIIIDPDDVIITRAYSVPEELWISQGYGDEFREYRTRRAQSET